MVGNGSQILQCLSLWVKVSSTARVRTINGSRAMKDRQCLGRRSSSRRSRGRSTLLEHGTLLDGTQKVVLFFLGLETTMTNLGGSVDKLELDLFQSSALDLWHQ